MSYKDTIVEDWELTDIAETLYNFRNAMDIEGIKNTLWQLANNQAKASSKKGNETMKQLAELSRACFIFLRRLDEVMKNENESEYRGRIIANLTNYLEMANDKVRYGSLGVVYRKDNKDKEWQTIKSKVARDNDY